MPGPILGKYVIYIKISCTVYLICSVLPQLTGEIVRELLAGQTLAAIQGVVESQATVTEEGESKTCVLNQ